MEINDGLLDNSRGVVTAPDDFYAVINAHGLYNSMRFVLRLSPEVHRKLSGLPTGIVTGKDVDSEALKAFSTYLHETIHWWQHIGTTMGLMLSLSYPAQAHANYTHLKKLLATAGPKKSVLQLSESLPESGNPETPSGLANIIVNNHLDIEFFKILVTNPELTQQVVNNPYFECVGHSYEIAYGNIILILERTLQENFRVIPDPRSGWENNFASLKATRTEGFYYGSKVAIAPVGVRHIFEGQARFAQLQYLYFTSGGKLSWDDVYARGMLSDLYMKAFQVFLDLADLEWPKSIDDPVVGLFLLVCDIACNPGEGFPVKLQSYDTFINDVSPGVRFVYLCQAIAMFCRDAAEAIRSYSREEYVQVSESLCQKLRLHSPLAVCHELARWMRDSSEIKTLMSEHRTFAFADANLPVRLLFGHHLAFNEDKLAKPEFFCWPGAWMAGERCSHEIFQLFERHKALFVDKADDESIFPIIHPEKDQSVVDDTFNKFYAANVMYDMSRQWTVTAGPFRYDYRWLLQSSAHADMKQWVDGHFERLFGVYPDGFEIL